VLQSGYTPGKRAFEKATLVVFACTWSVLAPAAWEGLGLVPLVAGVLCADFLVGVVHWALDTYGTVDTPLAGKLIRSFREHHIHPTAMCSHGAVEVSADNCIIPLPFMAAAALCGLRGPLACMFLCTVTLVALANQIHQWAHMPAARRPSVVRLLQSSGLILGPKQHARHHLPPHDRGYCILNGWCDPALEWLGFWRRLEKLVAAPPRVDDMLWKS